MRISKLFNRIGCSLSPNSALDSSRVESLIFEGRMAEEQGQLKNACERYREALNISPDHLAAHLNLGICLAALGNSSDAIEAYQAALAIEPDHAYTNYNLALLLFAEGAFDSAEKHLRAALRVQFIFPEAHVALANVLEARGCGQDAHDELALAIEQRPDYVGALYNYAILSNQLRLYEDAEDAIRRLLDVEPGNLEGLQVLALALWGQTRWAESIELFKSLRESVPWSFRLESKELFLLNFDLSITPDELFHRHREFGARFEQEYPARFPHFNGNLDPDRRLRVGYLSPDFKWHPIGSFMLPVLEQHDRAVVEVYCYSAGQSTDDMTKRLSRAADHWIDASKLTDAKLGEIIHGNGIDILVDLTGHTSTPTLEVFARRPAPVQVSWMGYLNTTGLTRMHYRLCDARTDPVGIADALHTEVLVRLPNSQWCYRPEVAIETAPRAPCEANGFVTFGSFNHTLKISPELCAVWAEVLLRVPNSRLVCVGLTSTRKMAELLSELTMTGVDSERIEMVGRTDLPAYFAWYNEVDIALDTFPYGGGTTTFDALWMGVPVVTATGSTPTSRSAASILAVLGLNEWIAPSIDEYVNVTVERARDMAQIGRLRRTLRPRLKSSPLMDEVTFVRDLESAYRLMWRTWCAGTVNRTGDL